MHKATPKANRSLRHIAEEKNRSANFEPDPPYFAQGGMPKTGTVVGAKPAEDVMLEQSKPSHPVNPAAPFTLGGKK